MRTDVAVPGASPVATAGFDLLGDFRTMMGINANLPGTTVVRVRGALQFNLTAGPGATSGVLLGARVSSIEGLGPASPLPSSSPSEDWMMFDWAPLDGLGRRLHRRHRHVLVRAGHQVQAPSR